MQCIASHRAQRETEATDLLSWKSREGTSKERDIPIDHLPTVDSCKPSASSGQITLFPGLGIVVRLELESTISGFALLPENFVTHIMGNKTTNGGNKGQWLRTSLPSKVNRVLRPSSG